MSFEKAIQSIEKGNYQPIYVFYGPESYLADQFITKLRAKLVDPAYADFNEQQIDGSKIAVDEAISAFETLPFFAEKRLVILRQSPWLQTQKTGLDDADEEKLLAYLNNPSPSTILVWSVATVDKRKRLGKCLAKSNALMECSKVDEAFLKKMIYDKLITSGCEISQENLQYCIYLLGYLEKDAQRTLYDVDAQLSRLIGAATQQHIDRALLMRVLEKPLDTNIFAYMDAVSDGKTADAMLIKKQLLSEDYSEIQINSMLYKHFRNLYKTQLLLDRGFNPTAIAQKLGVHPYSAKKYASACRYFKPQYLKQMIIDLAELDYRMKTGLIGFEQALDLMTVSLSQKLNLPL